MANKVDPDQTEPNNVDPDLTDLGLHCLSFLLTVLADSIYNILIFFADKM